MCQKGVGHRKPYDLGALPNSELRTERLILRRWRESDRAPFASMNADPEVMTYFVSTLTRVQSDALVDRIESGFGQHGFGLWAAERLDNHAFIGFVGLSDPAFAAHFMPAIEIGWRLAREHWHRGYATEGARACLAFGFEDLRLDEIVSFTAPANLPSRRVMERIGMTHDPRDDFDHPRVPEGHPLRRQVLYRLNRRDCLQPPGYKPAAR